MAKLMCMCAHMEVVSNHSRDNSQLAPRVRARTCMHACVCVCAVLRADALMCVDAWARVSACASIL